VGGGMDAVEWVAPERRELAMDWKTGTLEKGGMNTEEGKFHAEINLRNWGIILELDLTGGMWDYSFSVMLGHVYVDVSWDHHN